ncbi:SpvB/TcaC N-terminal domain-containing protein [Actinokineospora guangxiensis]|uniref:SpvB/TcaC N-terminal domain-containing protein n=1 Tax=Actinokineospora guangxiensis TaxID=1490288 RepID=A0ABW0EQE0_9PSEU
MFAWVPLRRSPGRARRSALVLGLIFLLIATGVTTPGIGLVSGAASGGSGVEVPEYPEGQLFDPNRIKDLKAGEPGAGVALIEAPAANNQGQARLGYPIEVPPGRAGLQPAVALAYNSGSAGSWTGVGWELAAPMISLDTRWGVPRYDPALETETYLLDGEQLTPVAHRGVPKPRAAEKVFHTRVEGKFRRIVRHGDAPANYWWEITEKNGTRHVYGRDDASTLADVEGNRAVWALAETRDTNDNFIRYQHAKVSDPGVPGGAVPGVNLYPDRITYTGNGTTEGRYSVTFQTDRERGESRRPDVAIDARYGFKKVTADLLRRVEVRLDDQLVRAYELEYRIGAFSKTLLASVSQIGADNARFTTHTFDYFDDIRDEAGGYDAFGTTTGWNIPDDGLSQGLRGYGDASALASTTSTGVGGHLYVGYNPTSPSKSNSAGVKVGYNAGSADGLLALADVNGDNLPDKVFRSGGGVYYRPNLSGPGGQPRFGDTPVRLPSLPAISSERTRSTTVGVESYFGVAAQLDYVSTTTTSDRYLADVNGDGITDLVNNGGVLFGRLDAQGNPVYTANSAETPAPIGSGAVSGPIVGDQTAEFERQVDQFPLLDGIRRWIAPHAGTVRVGGRVALVEDASPERAAYTKADGVRVAIQHEGDELWSQRIGPDDHIEFAPSGVDSIAVQRGDALYFRVQSVLDGRYDQVAWDPEVTYTGLPATQDVNGLDNHRYLASRDFTLAGRPSVVVAPLTGTLRLTGDVVKTGPTTDDVTVVVSRNGTDALTRALPAATGGTAAVDLEIPVTAGDRLTWRLKVDSPIDAGAVRWVPRAHYTAAEGVDSVVDENGDPTLAIAPPFEMDIYPASTLTGPQGHHTATATGTVSAQPALAFDFGGRPVDARVVFTAKKRGALLAKRVIDVVDGVVPPIGAVNVPATAGDELFFDFATTDPTLLGALTGQSVEVDGAPVPSALHAAAEQSAFAQPYRGWAAIGYQGNRARATAPVNEADLVIDEDFRDSLPEGPTEDDVPGFTENPTVETPKIVVFAPMPAQNRWAGADDNTWVGPASAASSRLGSDTIDVTTDADLAGATGVARRARTQQVSTTFGASLPGVPIGAGGSLAKGRSEGQVDFLDLNGDRFPDVVGAAGVQYSDMVGGLGSTRGSVGGEVRRSESLAYSVSANAGSPARTSSSARGQDAPTGGTNANSAKAGTEMPALGVGGSLGGGESDAAHDLIDINGDGLPDKVYDNGDAALNLGYSFAAREPWPGGPLNAGETENTGVNLGFNTDYYGFAGGVSASVGESSTDATLMDLTGDGLMDRVFAEGGGLSVAVNTGSGFAPRTPFRGALPGVNADANASVGGGAYFTFGFCFVFGCIVFNPGADVSAGVGRTEIALRDVNGDGYADHVKSTKDDQLLVAENRTGRTNLLKTVRRPMGGKIDLDYTRDGNTADAPESRWVLSRSALHDGHPGDGQDVQLTTFRYSEGKHDRFEREFLGYGRVVAEQRDRGADDAVYRTATDEYRTDSVYTRGLLTRSLTADGAGRKFLETVNTYRLRDVATGDAADAASATATVFPMLVRTDRNFYEGQTAVGKTSFVENEYDGYGNAIRTLDAADSGTADDQETRVSYSGTDPACAAAHIVGLPVASEVRGAGALMRRSEALVDCASANTTRVREFLADGSAATTDMAYFPNGTLASVTEPANKNGQRYKLDYTYETVVATHVETITDSFGYRSSTMYDLRFGLPTSETDFAGQRVVSAYDAIGRVDAVTGPYELPEDRVTIDFEYHPEAPVPYALTRHADRTADGPIADTIDTITYADGLKRTLQTKKDASVVTAPGADPVEVMTVSGRSVYDFVGRGVEHYYPVTEPKGDNLAFNGSFDTVAPTRQSFDVLDRVTRTVIPDGTASTSAHGFGADRAGRTQFEVVATDANGKQRRTYTDVRGLTTAVKEFNAVAGQPVIWTSYTHDPLRQITAAVDDRGNTTASAYDNLGRRTVVDSPDAGRTETRYDLAGNVIAKVTAVLRSAGKAVEYDYDFTRVTAIRYPTFTGNNIAYTYGAPGAADGTANRIATVRDAAGTVARAYGPLGELVRETRTVTAINGPARTYTTSYAHDSFNRVMRMTYPDGEVLTYEYDTGGQVHRATGRKGDFDYTYLHRLDYDKFGQRSFQVTGTGVRTSYAYDPADRQLATLKSALPDGHEFQNLSYTYDKVGNVRQVRNAVALPHGKPIGGPSVQSFTYDDLYQLTAASGEYRNKQNKLDRQSLTLRYDTLHNVTLKNQRHEIVNNAQTVPPADTSTGTVYADPTAGTLVDPALAPVGPVEEPAEEPLQETLEAGTTTGNAQVQKKTTYDYDYTYGSAKPHAASKVGPVNQAFDANGNLVDTVNTEPPAPGKRRQLVWDEENRLACNQDHSRNRTVAQDPSTCVAPQQPATVRYVYDDKGNRVVKDAGPKHIYPNQNFSERNGTGFKHIWIGDTRLATKTVKPDTSYENHQFFFHADHLGSSSFVTDERAILTEHLEYFAFGETWVDENPAQPTPVPYQFGGKELDEETGLYYHGARYYNPKTAQWQSPDPALDSYLDGEPNNGVFQPFNLASYTFANNNPVRLTDPTGASTWNRVMGGLKVVGGVLEMAAGAAGGAATSWTGVGAVAGGVVVVHGADVTATGLRQLWTGEQESSLTSQAIQAAGVSRENADLVDAGISVVGSMGTSAMAQAPRAVTATAPRVVAQMPYSSRLLGQNLVRAGYSRPAQTAAHHIVAGGDARASAARAVLQRFGIALDDAANGVFLPSNLSSANAGGAAVHSTVHTDRYYAAVNALIGRAQNRQQVIQSLGHIRQRLLSGGFP